MAAEVNNGSGGSRNYYNISFGKLSSKVKEVPDGYTEIVEADLKAKIQAVEQVDLRNKYINKAKGDYPYVVFYDSLTGTIVGQNKKENDHGTFLELEINDKDGDTSLIQVNFYSKYAENLLNRLINSPQGVALQFMPYQMPSSFELDGKNKAYYNQGVSLKVGETKVEPKYKADDAELPKTTQVKVQGKPQTSRDERVDFLYEKFLSVFKPSEGTTPKQEMRKVDETKSTIAQPVANSDLPF